MEEVCGLKQHTVIVHCQKPIV